MQSNSTDRAAKISILIQQELRSRKMKSVDPATATNWLLKKGLQGKKGSRPGSFLRSLCRKGLIAGAEKHGSKWQIEKKKIR
jgi:hypothetical protein